MVIDIAMTKVQDLILVLLNLIKFSWTHSSGQLRDSWMAFLPSSESLAPLIHRLAKGAFNPILYVTDEDI